MSMLVTPPSIPCSIRFIRQRRCASVKAQPRHRRCCVQASGGSVALPAAGYDYNSNWTPLLAGLSPAGMAASLAAPDHGRANPGPYGLAIRLCRC